MQARGAPAGPSGSGMTPCWYCSGCENASWKPKSLSLASAGLPKGVSGGGVTFFRGARRSGDESQHSGGGCRDPYRRGALPRPFREDTPVATDLAQGFRTTFGQFPTGVTIVTASGPHGPAGMTTNAVTSLSLDPLLLLVCFDNTSRTLPVVRETGRFAVNVLRAGQEELAAVFASKQVAAEKFEAVTHTVAHGVPVLDGALAWVACDLRELHAGGDHTIGVGAVTHTDHDPDGEPLVFFRGRYRRLG